VNCPICRSENAAGTEKCTRCGTVLVARLVAEQPSQTAGASEVDYQRPLFGAPPALGPSRATPEFGWLSGTETIQKTATSLIGGVLVLIGGIISCLIGVLDLILSTNLAQVGMAIIGGIFGIMRNRFSLAVIGAIFCMLSMGFVYISVVLGILGLLMLMLARHDFD
jgi:hypothetical protein